MKTFFLLAVTLLSISGFCLKTSAQPRWRIDQVKPDRVYIMNKFDLIGGDFGDRKPRNTMVMMKLDDYGLQKIYKPRVLEWSNKRIRIETPDWAIPGNYTVGIYFGTETKLISNEMSLTVLGGIVIRSVMPNPASPGDTIEISGVHFGGNQVVRYVSINRFGTRTRLRIVDWSDRLIRAQIPDRAGVGNYVLLIYYDETRVVSSDGVDFTIERRRD